MPSFSRVFPLVVLICAIPLVCASWAFESKEGKKIWTSELSSASVEVLVELLQSEDGATRVAATRELFRRGKAVLPQLRKAGAKPMTTIRPPRLDVVYSLIQGLNPGNYRDDSFGIHLESGAKREEVLHMEAEYGFSIPPDFQVRSDKFPSVYVELQPGKNLESVLKNLLASESLIITVNLNYFEH